ncbi:MAG TPA: hypothetical protein VMU06_07555 [Stellaceae bacterium]|nr:hypothetical protein [Stellaceae bacterium]
MRSYVEMQTGLISALDEAIDRMLHLLREYGVAPAPAMLECKVRKAATEEATLSAAIERRDQILRDVSAVAKRTIRNGKAKSA